METSVLHRYAPSTNPPSVEAPGRMRYSDLPPLQHELQAPAGSIRASIDACRSCVQMFTVANHTSRLGECAWIECG